MLARKNFFDFQSLLKQTTLYMCSLGLVAIFFFSSEFLIEKFFYNNDELVDVACAVGGVLLFHFIRLFFDHITDKIFFRKDYDYARAIYEIGPLLTITIDLKFLLKGVYDFLLDTVKPERVIFIFDEASSPIHFNDTKDGYSDSSRNKDYRELADQFSFLFNKPMFMQDQPEDEMTRDVIRMARALGVVAIIPLALKEESRAVMLLGKRLSDRSFRIKDIGLVTALAQQASMAIRNARLYEEVRQYSEILELRVFERTEKIRSMYELQSNFLTEVSHELQTPVAILRGNLDMLENRSGSEWKRSLRVISTTVGDMSRLINSLLESARLKFSKNIFYKENVCVGTLLQEIYEDCSILAEDKEITISLSVEELWIHADRSRIKEVVLNLISNALKHTPRGGSIFLRGKRNNDVAQIRVQDTGSGISPDDLAHIFDRFYKIHDPRFPRAPSTGIGLDICRQVIKAHAGSITVESEVGKGSAFIIELPILL